MQPSVTELRDRNFISWTSEFVGWGAITITFYSTIPKKTNIIIPKMCFRVQMGIPKLNNSVTCCVNCKQWLFLSSSFLILTLGYVY